MTRRRRLGEEFLDVLAQTYGWDSPAPPDLHRAEPSGGHQLVDGASADRQADCDLGRGEEEAERVRPRFVEVRCAVKDVIVRIHCPLRGGPARQDRTVSHDF